MTITGDEPRRENTYPAQQILSWTQLCVFVCHLCGRRKRRFSDTEQCWTIFEISRGPLPSLWEKQEISVFKTPLRSDFEIFHCFRWKSHSLYRLSVDEVSYCRGQLLMGPSSRRRLPYFSPLIQSRIRRTRWTGPVHEWNFTMQLRTSPQVYGVVIGNQLWLRPCSDLVTVPGHGAWALKWKLFTHASARNYKCS